ncbi:MAG: sugar transferase [Pseudomonadota bacterium]
MVYRHTYKRIIDIGISLALLLFLLPVFAILYISIIFFLGSPAIFTQVRPGRHGKLFKIYKFRTMTDAKDPSGNLFPDSVRLTDFGRFLRRTSLDELPELYNVLKGDMSLVGPRPLLTEYLPYYSIQEQRRHLVRPGITGWAQINGRNMCPWNERLWLDIWYVDNCSLALDIKILVITIFKVMKRDGISEDTAMVEVKLNEERGRN